MKNMLQQFIVMILKAQKIIKIVFKKLLMSLN